MASGFVRERRRLPPEVIGQQIFVTPPIIQAPTAGRRPVPAERITAEGTPRVGFRPIPVPAELATSGFRPGIRPVPAERVTVAQRIALTGRPRPPMPPGHASP